MPWNRILGARLGALWLALVLGGSMALLGPGPMVTEHLEPMTLSVSMVWVRQFGTSGNDSAYAIAMGPDGLYVAGEVEGSLDGQPYAGLSDGFLRKYDADGNVTWTRQWGSFSAPPGLPTVEGARGVVADGSAVYVVGLAGDQWGLNADARKYLPSGDAYWMYQYGSTYTDERAFAVALDEEDLYIAGREDGGSGNPLAGWNAFIQRLNVTNPGHPDFLDPWIVKFGSSEDDWASTITVDAGDVYCGGGTAGTLFDGANNGTLTDAFVTKWNGNLSLEWSDQFLWSDGSSQVNENVNGLSAVGGRIYAVGGTERDPGWNAFAKMYQSDGTEVWNETFAASEQDVAWGVFADATGAYVTGHTEGEYPGEESAGSLDAFVRHYDYTGATLWTRQFGTSGQDVAWAITGDGSDLYIAGETYGTFPGQAGYGNKDAFVAKIRMEAANQPPVADAGGPYTGVEGSEVALDAGGSSDPDGDSLQYRWDFENDGVADTPWSSSPTSTHVWSDDYSGEVRAEVSDGKTTSSATATVTILNLPPTIDSVHMPAITATARLRIAGEKWHDVAAYIVDGGNETFKARLVRGPGKPQETSFEVGIDATRTNSLRIAYTPEDDPVNGQPNGATPAWLTFAFDSGPPVEVHHTFNVKHPETWNWTVSLNSMLAGRSIDFTATATDPGSDDLTFEWDWGDGTPAAATTYYNDGTGSDPYPSPGGIFPFTATDSQVHPYATTGMYELKLTVRDDDGGVGEPLVVIIIV